MLWINFSWIDIGGVAVLLAGQGFSKNFFGVTILRSIVDDRVLNRPKLKGSGTFLHLDQA
jgi:hypothetical protein